MGISFLRGNPQAPRGHAILIARSSSNPRIVYSTYCIVPPIPMSIAKWLPPLLAAQLPTEELRGAANIAGMPIPPMLEEGLGLDQLEGLAERRDDDLCDIGSVASVEVERLRMAAESSQEYAQLYADYTARTSPLTPARNPLPVEEATPLDEVDAEELLLQSMSDRQKIAELGKLIGMARYALDGHDADQLKETQRRMERIARLLPDKYRGSEVVAAATNANERGARLAELYLSRAYKLLDEEYAAIPGIERAIRELQE